MGIRGALHHKREPSADPNREPSAHPNRPHQFKAPGAHWLVDGVPPSAEVGPGGVPLAAASAGMRFADRRCAVCGRVQSDLIHAPED